jgi:hypothetical protein
MTDRRTCFRRALTGGLVLTPRDVTLILAVYEHQWLTRQQVQRLTAIPGVTRVNQRLRQLYDGRYLDRIRAGTVGAGLQPVYVAGEAAVPLIAAETGRPVPEIRDRLRQDAQASACLLPHDLLVNDVRISIGRALEGPGGMRLETWLNPPECFDAYKPGRVLRPDGYFRVTGDLLYAFFLEVDRGTNNLGRWQAKVERYLDYRDGSFYQARYGLTRFRVLATAHSPARLAHLVRVTRELTDRSFWFALTSDVVVDGRLDQPVWWSVGVNQPRPLLTHGDQP